MTANPSELDALDSQIADLTAQMRGLFGTDKIGSPEYRLASDTHAMAVHLRDFNGGTPEQRAEVARRLAELEAR